MKIPKIAAQTEDEIIYRVPSKSRKELMQLMAYSSVEKPICTCEGAHWIKQRGLDKTCRHQKETTIANTCDTPLESLDALNHVLYLIKKKQSAETMWSYVTCLNTDKRGELRCTNCPLYPYVCNIHLMRFGNMKPLVWKLQTSLYNRQWKKSRNLIKEIRKHEQRCNNTEIRDKK